MLNSISAIDWLSVFVAFVSYFVLGALWFTLLFKKHYLKSLGKENEAAQKPAPIFIVGPAICSFVITLTTALLMSILQLNSYAASIEFAVVIGIGYLVANTVNIAINPNIPKPLFYGVISGAYHLIGITGVCLILYAMN